MKNSNTQNTSNSTSKPTVGRMPAAAFYSWLAALLVAVAVACQMLLSFDKVLVQLQEGRIGALVIYFIIIGAALSLAWLMRPGNASGRMLGPCLVIFLLIANMGVSSYLAHHERMIVQPGTAIFWVAIHFIVGVGLAYQLAFGPHERVYFEGGQLPPRTPPQHSISIMFAKFGCFVLFCWAIGQTIGMPGTLIHAETAVVPYQLGLAAAAASLLIMVLLNDQRPVTLFLAAALHLAAIAFLLLHFTVWWQALVAVMWLGMAIIFVLAAASA